ncbi:MULTISPECIES: sporulation protein [unclassified Nocardiopsis]|uniref:sporulation protein n=1 Tax=unclassified Nocardiopsis TaxID=2649073 RepID=UPI00048D11AA|nr:sporulation protein [Nocardiopsis sp. CNT312]
MVLKRLLAGIGVGGATVETVLDTDRAQPGGALRGTVHVQAGDVEQKIDRLTVGLQARVEVESGDYESVQDVEFHRVQLGGEAAIAPGQTFSVPFQLSVPWETPISSYGGRPLHHMNLGVNTRLEVAKAVDPGDLDPVAIEPLPSQAALLDALVSLGFGFQHADVEKGRVLRTRQTLPFYQEFEYRSPGHYQGLNSLELTMVSDHAGMDVVLELDKKPGLLFSESRDTFHSLSVGHQEAVGYDWRGYLHHWIGSLAGRRRLL